MLKWNMHLKIFPRSLSRPFIFATNFIELLQKSQNLSTLSETNRNCFEKWLDEIKKFQEDVKEIQNEAEEIGQHLEYSTDTVNISMNQNNIYISFIHNYRFVKIRYWNFSRFWPPYFCLLQYSRLDQLLKRTEIEKSIFGMNIGGMTANNPSWTEFLKITIPGTIGSCTVILCVVALAHRRDRH
jgi:hypothetical protein